MNKKVSILVIIVASISLLSLISLLFYRLSEPYLWTDEVFSYLAAQKIIETGKPILDTGLEYTRSPIYHYVLAFFLDKFGGSYTENLFASRLPNIIAIVFTSLVTYLFTFDSIKSATKGKLQLLNYLIPIIPVLLFLSSNFTVALARETRMYALAQLSMLTIAYTFYKAIIENNRSIKVLGINMNISWSIALLIAILTAIFIQPITLLIGIGIVLFLAYYSYTTKSYAYLLLAISAIVVLPIVGLALYDTANPVEIIQYMNPYWGESSSYFYYILLGARNMPIILFALPAIIIAIYFAMRNRNSSIMYVAILLSAYMIIISTLASKNERYFQPIIPIVFILTTVSTYFVYFQWKERFNKIIRFALIGISAAAITVHLYLYIKELNEISTFTSTSIMQHKKMDFEEVSGILDLDIEQNEDIEIIADYHSAFTLYTMGYDVKNILIPTNHLENRVEKTDKYIGIPYLYYETNFESEIADENIDIVIVRDPKEYIEEHGMTDLVDEKYTERPLLFMEK